jgi:hypothetical protein
MVVVAFSSVKRRVGANEYVRTASIVIIPGHNP